MSTGELNTGGNLATWDTLAPLRLQGFRLVVTLYQAITFIKKITWRNRKSALSLLNVLSTVHRSNQCCERISISYALLIFPLPKSSPLTIIIIPYTQNLHEKAIFLIAMMSWSERLGQLSLKYARKCS